mmetsp:Transcript_53814/g.125156  ORF Transcript_53814/g.125156 Transcript_53814/m.125156 type:complete len:274 (+) Transcript_53814:994-1815(+)
MQKPNCRSIRAHTDADVKEGRQCHLKVRGAAQLPNSVGLLTGLIALHQYPETSGSHALADQLALGVRHALVADCGHRCLRQRRQNHVHLLQRLQALEELLWNLQHFAPVNSRHRVDAPLHAPVVLRAVPAAGRLEQRAQVLEDAPLSTSTGLDEGLQGLHHKISASDGCVQQHLLQPSLVQRLFQNLELHAVLCQGSYQELPPLLPHLQQLVAVVIEEVLHAALGHRCGITLFVEGREHLHRHGVKLQPASHVEQKRLLSRHLGAVESDPDTP